MKNQIFCNHPELIIRLISANEAHVKTTGDWQYIGHHTLELLRIFSQPKSIESAMQELKDKYQGKQDWVDFTSTLMLLKKYQFILSGNEKSSLSSHLETYEQSVIHTQMLNDSVRTLAFIDAIKKNVSAGDVVVEIGTGSGVLAMAAARAGAKKVYAIEATAIADTAEALFRENGLENIITVIRGWSTQISLPEKCDVLISEMLGNDPFAEQVNELTLDAVERFLKPEFKMVPQNIEVELTLYEAPEQFIDTVIFTSRNTAEWTANYKDNYSKLISLQANTQQIMYLPQKMHSWKALSHATSLCSIDMKQNHLPDLNYDIDILCDKDGMLNAIVLHYRLILAAGIELNIDPKFADKNNHWTCPVWLINQHLNISSGNRIHIDNQRSHSYSPGAIKINMKDNHTE